jgi:hypothetical protein
MKEYKVRVEGMSYDAEDAEYIISAPNEKAAKKMAVKHFKEEVGDDWKEIIVEET